MPLIPIARILFSWLGLVLLVVAAYLVWSWWNGEVDIYAAGVAVRLREDWRLWTALAIVAFNLFGRFPILLFLAKGDVDPTRPVRSEGRMVASPTGASLYVETEGSAEGPVVIATHGWGLDSTIWRYLKRDMGVHRALAPHLLITWDLAGIGRSKTPADGRIGLEGFATDLEALIKSVAPRPVILIGHSIGGMTIQTLARDRPDAFGQVAGLILLNTTYTNPLRTMVLSGLAQTLRKPVLEPVFKAAILLKPLAWLGAWQGYLNGTAHMANRLQFAGSVTRSQLDHTTLLGTRNSPAVLAKGNLAMFGWDATAALTDIKCPVLILGGDQDIVTKLEASQTIDAQAAGARLEPVSDANHMGFLERSHHYNGLIVQFIAAIATSPRPTMSTPSQ